MIGSAAVFRAALTDNLVKPKNFRWLSKKLHMLGAQIFYHFGVLEYVIMIEILQQRRR